MVTVLLILGSSGLAWSLIGSAVFAFFYLFFNYFISAPERTTVSHKENISIDFLLPAHNEASTLPATISSLVDAIQSFNRTAAHPLHPRLYIGLDHCTDNSAQILQHLQSTLPVELHYLEHPGQAGKWNTLLFLLAQSTSEWIAWVDAGSIWHPMLLTTAMPQLLSGRYVGIAPSYCPAKAGLLEQLYWKLERTIKYFENFAGGPVTVHGATVLYRRVDLVAALPQLPPVAWLNDDVVVPMQLRTLGHKIHYLDRPFQLPAWVNDIGVVPDAQIEYRRRSRMVVGNLQWIQHLWFPSLTRAPVVFVLASRRVARLCWAYWCLAIGLSISLKLYLSSSHLPLFKASVGFIFFLSVVFLFFMSNWFRRFASAFASGLRLPALLLQSFRNRTTFRWN